MSDPHASITLTFRTPAAAAIVLEAVLAAVNKQAMPYELSGANCHSFDIDDLQD